MNMPNVHAGRLERRVRRVGNEIMPDFHGFCSLFPFDAICGKPLLRLTAVLKSKRQDLTPFFSGRLKRRGFCSLPWFMSLVPFGAIREYAIAPYRAKRLFESVAKITWGNVLLSGL